MRKGEGDIGWTKITLALLVVSLLATPAAQASNTTSAVPLHHEPLLKKTTKKAKAKKAANYCPDARRAIAYYRLRHSSWLELMGIKTELRVKDLRAPHGCAYTVWVAKRWQQRAANARKAYLRWKENHFILRDFRVGPGNSAWLRAVDEAQKAYPGTKSWLLSCSSTEGGWGRWVVNPASGVGGWLQFMSGTWSTMWYGWYGNIGAYASLKARGFVVPASAHSWYSPLGQALAGAHGMLNGRRGEWHGSGCR